MSVLVEIERGASPNTIYVLQAENVQHQGTRQPTVITIPGLFEDEAGEGGGEKGQVRIFAYDLGIAQETLTISGICDTANRTAAVGDPAYEAGKTKVYPGKLALRKACLIWWADAELGSLPPTGLITLSTPLGDEYGVIVQQYQFNLEPGKDYYTFSIVFRIVSGDDYYWKDEEEEEE